MKEKIVSDLNKMSAIISEMVDLVYKGFIENDAHFLNMALNKERVMDDLEREITSFVIKESKTLNEKEKAEYILLGMTAQNIERMGDELRSLMERIEIKIAENLYFSDIGVKQYQEIFHAMRESLVMVSTFFKEKDAAILDKITGNGEKIKMLIEGYRREHMKRLAEGLCEPRASNMYFDMLDFTGNVARHCTNIARTHKGK